MLYRTLYVFVPLALSTIASAQAIDVSSAQRFLEVETHGFDYEYDDGILFTLQSPATSGDWYEFHVADQIDYWGFGVATAWAEADTAIETTALSFDFDTISSTAGNHFSADARSECSFEVHFELQDRVRFTADFFAASSLGYNTANVTLSIDQGPTLYAADGDYGATDSVLATGWLAPGDYVLRGSAESFAFGTPGVIDTHFARCTAELLVFHPLDYHMDGDVTRLDRRDFRRALLIGHPSADFDENGVVNAADWAGYWLAWRAY